MTAPTAVVLPELAAEGSDADFIKQSLQLALQRLIEMDVDALCKAAYGERSEERINRRSGYHEHALETRAGTIGLEIPKLRSGSYFPEFLKPRGTAADALMAIILEACLQGISTQSVNKLVKAMVMSGVSRSQISRLCEEIRVCVQAYLQRPLDGDWPYLCIEAKHVKTRQAGRVVSVAVIVAVAINTDGVREIIGISTGAFAEPFWTEFLRGLTRRGLRGVKLVISDAHEGLKAAIELLQDS